MSNPRPNDQHTAVLSSSKSLVLFVVSRPDPALNTDVRDELLGYAADVRLSAVSCLQIHLEIDFPSLIGSSPSAELKE